MRDYCEAQCTGPESETYADDWSSESYPAEDAACILENSSEANLNATVTFFNCIKEQNAPVVECINGLMACDDTALDECLEGRDISGCTEPDQSYQDAVDMACFPEDEGDDDSEE